MKQSNLLGYYLMSVLAGGINFSFNLFLLKRLGPLEFKNFSLWFTYVSTALFLATLTQYFFFYSPLTKERIKSTTFKMVIVLGLLHALFLIVPATWALAILTVYVFMVVAVYSAFFQRQLGLWKIGLLAMIGAVSKYALVLFLGPEENASYYSAVVYASALLSFLGCLACFYGPRDDLKLEGEFHSLTEATHGALVMAFLASLIPQLDFLIISSFNDQLELVAFSRIVILEKIIFFGFLIFNQMLLAMDNHVLFKKYNIGRKSEWLILGAFFFVLFFGEALLPIPLHFLDISSFYGPVAQRALLHALLLCLIFLKSQTLVNFKLVRRASSFLFILAAGYLVIRFTHRGMGPYLKSALIIDSIFICALYLREFYKDFSIFKTVA